MSRPPRASRSPSTPKVQTMTPPPPSSQSSEVQALLDAVRAGNSYDDFDAKPHADVGHGESGITDLLRQIQSQWTDLTRGRDALAAKLRETEGHLQKVSAEAATLRTERDHLTRLKTLYERKFASIRELTQQ